MCQAMPIPKPSGHVKGKASKDSKMEHLSQNLLSALHICLARVLKVSVRRSKTTNLALGTA